MLVPSSMVFGYFQPVFGPLYKLEKFVKKTVSINLESVCYA